jgi:putative salt-induced outer membrane protein
MKRILLMLAAAVAIGSAAETDIENLKVQIADREAEVETLKKELSDAMGPEPEPLKTHAELGYIKTSGNTETESFSATLNIKKAFGNHLLRFDAEGYYSSENEKETKNRWKTVGNYDYPDTSSFMFNFMAGYEADKFSGYDSQFYTGPGIKWKAIEPPAHELNLQANILYSSDDIADSIDPDTNATIKGETHGYAAFQAKVDYNWQISEEWKFVQIASYRAELEEMGDNYFINSKTAIESKISDIFSMGISYTVDYKNDAPADKEKTDSTFLISLIMDYNPII